MKLKVIITGTTGMVGEGVLLASLENPIVERVLVVNRRSCNIIHPKLIEVIHNDFHDLSSIEEKLTGYNACFYCLGVTSIGISEKDYTKLTFDLTTYFASTLLKLNNDMTFCYVSGAGTSGNEHSKNMWMRVKSKTENALLAMPCKAAYMFRPAYIQPLKSAKNTHFVYKPFAPFYSVWRKLFPKYVSTLNEIAKAMINCSTIGYEKKILESADIVEIAQNIKL